ncbi:FAD-binding oxidoreductase [Actinomycetospora chiangmaiensis]|uniref:FAD-binding oxidoreductase n=1 Tax=Actinomycetospora chiangmaiensis TaxID=402650 RepID=UPI0004758ED0|nr:FAD-binding oxidoreductase [Actinomycetospora chiangmaiensis]
MSTMVGRNFEALRAVLTGPLVEPSDLVYDELRGLWNGDVDGRPAAIARCATRDDVAAAIAHARAERLPIAVRGGGHGYSGLATVDGGLVIDLRDLRSVIVDTEARTAAVGGGATMADLDAATATYGLAVPGGVISHTGVGGLTLGGGMGWLTAAFGLALDNVVAAEVVLADGRVVVTDATTEPDLFWAIRGGGGNFGVVTEFTFALHPIPPELQLGLFFWGVDDGEAALRHCRDVVAGLPDDAGVLIAAGLCAPPAPFVPERHHLALGHALLVVGLGTAEEHAATVAPVREGPPPLWEFVTPIPYPALQQMLDDSAPWGIRAYEKAADLPELTDGAIEVIAEAARKKSSPMSFLPIFPLHGAYCRPEPGSTAFGGSRRPHLVCNINAVAPTAELLAAERAWARRVWHQLMRWSGNAGSYLNFQTEIDEERVRAAYGADTYERLARIKRRYDPDNVFRRNHNIRPAP